MAEVAHPQIKVQSPTENNAQALSFSPPQEGVIITRDADPRNSNSSDVRPQLNGKGFPAKLIRPRSSNRTNSFSNSDGRRDSNAGMDPLSKHIIQRTGVPSPQKARPGEGAEDGGASPTSPSRTSTDPGITRTDSSVSMSKELKKSVHWLQAVQEVNSSSYHRNRVSFLGRFLSKRRDSLDVREEEEEEDVTDKRAEGAEAETFSQPLGYIPKYPEPPKYIKVRSRGKKEKDFDRVFLAQELRGRTGVEVAQAGGRKINPSERAKQGQAIWALEFSKDGRYLAAGGHDHIVRVWAVIATEDDRAMHEKQEELAKDGSHTRLSAPVFKASPVQEYEGHTASVLDLSWSKNNFLLSSSMDKTVRLWHTSRAECLCAFKHSDFVTSIQFHPRDDRFFLAGSLDSKLRLWSIPDKSVAHWTQLNELITSVAFTPDGKTAIAGCLSGACIFYETEGLKQLTQMHVRSAHGKNSKGSKITGIQSVNYPPTDPNGDVKLLITSNDSRVRVYNFRDKSLELKLKGAENNSSQIRASFSDDARFIISGSEDKKAYIWSTGPPEKDKDKRPMEMFEAHSSTVTAAIMAPIRTRQLLQSSGDPLFDICNPPPIQLISRTDSRSSKGTDAESVPPTPSHPKRPEENPAWISRSAHPNGNIIVTADFSGHIKVFRQDCAYKQRLRNNENWDASSTFSKKMLHRSSSIATRASKQSTRDSLAYPSDRILSWRQSIDRSSAAPSMNSSHDTFPHSPHRSSFARSISPRKSFPSNPRTNSTSHAHPLSASSTPSIQLAASFASSTHSADAASSLSKASTAADAHRDLNVYPKKRQTALLNAPEHNPLLISDTIGTSSAFYDRAQYESLASATRRKGSVDINGNPVDGGSGGTEARSTRSVRSQSMRSYETASEMGVGANGNGNGNGNGVVNGANGSGNLLVDETGHLKRPPVGGNRIGSVGSEVSVLSSEVEGSEADEGERCGRCGSENFRARRKGPGVMVLECVRCGKVAE
ncbi:MAG: hypothetical protein MMC23_003484 [Stictis urceolatum]|nr:hypothetical protein [Stictis urceolata]